MSAETTPHTAKNLESSIDETTAIAERRTDQGVGTMGDMRKMYDPAGGGWNHQGLTKVLGASRAVSKRRRVGTGVRDQPLYPGQEDNVPSSEVPVDIQSKVDAILATTAMGQLADAFYKGGNRAMRDRGVQLRAQGTIDRVKRHLNTTDTE